MKKLFKIMLIAIICLAVCSCSIDIKETNTAGQAIKPEAAGQELNIIYDAMDIGFSAWEPFKNYKRSFEKQYGVKVNLITIGDAVPSEEYMDNLLKELSVKLQLKEGPELIFFNGGYSYEKLVEQKAVLNVKNKIENIKGIYPSLVADELYCVPVTMTYRPIVLNSKVLEVLKVEEPDHNWTKESYYSIRDKWLNKSQTEFTYYEFQDIINRYLSDIDILNAEEKTARINTVQIADCIKKIRAEIFSGKYKLKNNYKYENYYNMLYEYLSKEYKEDSELRHSEKYNSQVLRNRRYEHTTNPLKAKDGSYKIARCGAVVMPEFGDGASGLIFQGFLLNRNGKNTELACEFINGLLGKEVQQQIYEDSGDDYPIIQELEGTIRKIEAEAKLDNRAIKLKEHILEQIKSGKCKLWTDSYTDKESKLLWRLEKDLTKYILADRDYSDDELSKELQKLEDKYNIWLNE